MTWTPTGKIRYRNARAFGRRKLILQLQEKQLMPTRFGDVEKYYRWRDATTEDLPVQQQENTQ